jgi:hypothetical protein
MRPYVDTSSKKRTPDWLVTARLGGSRVRTFRFADEQSAQAFVAAFEKNPPRAVLDYHVRHGEAITGE